MEDEISLIHQKQVLVSAHHWVSSAGRGAPSFLRGQTQETPKDPLTRPQSFLQPHCCAFNCAERAAPTPLVAQMVRNLPALQETQVRSLGREDALEKEMAAHSSILAWRIPWTEEPGGLQSMGSLRVGHD